MEVGFDTIGNAALIVYDRGPLLVADPWIKGSAYFGSWSLSHQIPPEQLVAIGKAEYVWFARTDDELKAYFSEYRRRMAPLAYVRHQLERQAAGVFRSQVSQDSPAYRVAERAF
jgi:hypothetical protein